MLRQKDEIIQFINYSFKVLPVLRKLIDRIAAEQYPCFSPLHLCHLCDVYSLCGSNTALFDSHLLCGCLFALHPGVDIKKALTFILSLHMLAKKLEIHSSGISIKNPAEIHSLYNCLSASVNTSRSNNCIFAFGGLSEDSGNSDILGNNGLKVQNDYGIGKAAQKDNGNDAKPEQAMPCFCEQLRLQLSNLPSYHLVLPKLKKYMQYYIELQSYKHYPSNIRIEHLEAWSSYYVKRLRNISCWEFCASSDSLIGVAMMYAAANDPRLTAEDINRLDEACFPWLCGLESLLNAYVYARADSYTGNLNYSSFYENLKVQEERLLYFEKQAEAACMRLKEKSFYLSFIRAMTGIYLAAPEASFGMYGLASRNIFKKSLPGTALFSRFFRMVNSSPV